MQLSYVFSTLKFKKKDRLKVEANNRSKICISKLWLPTYYYLYKNTCVLKTAKNLFNNNKLFQQFQKKVKKGWKKLKPTFFMQQLLI